MNDSLIDRRMNATINSSTDSGMSNPMVSWDRKPPLWIVNQWLLIVDWLIGGLIDWQIDRLFVVWLIDWSIADCLIDWLIRMQNYSWLMDWNDSLNILLDKGWWLINWLTKWLTCSLTCSLTEWLIGLKQPNVDHIDASNGSNHQIYEQQSQINANRFDWLMDWDWLTDRWTYKSTQEECSMHRSISLINQSWLLWSIWLIIKRRLFDQLSDWLATIGWQWVIDQWLNDWSMMTMIVWFIDSHFHETPTATSLNEDIVKAEETPRTRLVLSIWLWFVSANDQKFSVKDSGTAIHVAEPASRSARGLPSSQNFDNIFIDQSYTVTNDQTIRLNRKLPKCENDVI